MSSFDILPEPKTAMDSWRWWLNCETTKLISHYGKKIPVSTDDRRVRFEHKGLCPICHSDMRNISPFITACCDASDYENER